MMINLNQANIEKYKSEVGIKSEYKGRLDLFSWKDELNYLEDVEEDMFDMAEYDYEDQVNSDMEEDVDEVEED